MLIDPTYAAELAASSATTSTLNFIKRVMAGLYYVDAQVSGSTVTCQVKTGDGQNYSAMANVTMKLAGTGIPVPPALSAPPSVSMMTGSVHAGGGTNILWIQTTNTGSFSFTVGGSGSVLVDLTPNQGVSMSVGVG